MRLRDQAAEIEDPSRRSQRLIDRHHDGDLLAGLLAERIERAPSGRTGDGR